MGGHAPPLGALLSRAHVAEDDPAPPLRPAHAALLARALRDAALSHDWPRAAALSSLALLAQPVRQNKQSVYHFSHSVPAVLPLAQLSVEVAQRNPAVFSVEDELALRREARRRALTRDDVAAAEGETMQTVALLAVRGGDTARAAAELGRRPPRRGGPAASAAAAAARARLAALLAYAQWAALAVPRPPPAAGEDAPSPFDPPNFPKPVAQTAKALRRAALPLAREAFTNAPSDSVLAGVLIALQLAGKGARTGRRAVRTAARLVRAAPDDPEAWRLYRLLLSSPAGASGGGDASEEGWDCDRAVRKAASSELRLDPSSESALEALLALRVRRACSAHMALCAAAAHAEVCPACPTAWRHLATALGAPPRPTAGRRAAAAWTPQRAAEWRARFFSTGGGVVGPPQADARTLRDIGVVAAHLRASGRGGGAFGRAVAQRLAAAGHVAFAMEVRAAYGLSLLTPDEPPPSAWDARTSPFDDVAGDDGDAAQPDVRSQAAPGSPGGSLSLSPRRSGAARQGPCALCAHGRKSRLQCRVRLRHTEAEHVAEECEACRHNAAVTSGAAGEPPLLRVCARCFHVSHATARYCRMMLGHTAAEHQPKGCATCAERKDKRRAKREADAAAAAAAPAAKKARTADSA